MNNKIILISSIAIGIGVSILYKIITRDNTFEKKYKEILTSEKYKVKGQYD